MRWEKKEKRDHWQCLGAGAAVILGARRTESGAGRCELDCRLARDPRSQNGKPKDSDFLSLIVCASIRGDTEQVRQDKK